MNKMMLIVAVVASGCGSSYYATTCDTTLVAKLGGDNGENFGCARIISNIELAKKYIMQDWKLKDGTTVQFIQDEAEWQHFFGGINIWVSRHVEIEDPLEDGTLKGYYDGLQNEIQVAVDHKSLMHEMFHRIESQRLQVGTINHEGWNEKGYMQPISAYVNNFENYVGAR